MNKLTSTLGVFAATAAIAAAFAMSPAPTKVEAKSSNNDPYWFRLSDGSFITQQSENDQQIDCKTPDVPCAVGYLEYDFETGTPLSSPIPMDGEEEL